MSEEKKPTDEEIAKAILQQIEYNAGIPYINEWQQVKTIKFTEILDFIQHLQGDNKRLSLIAGMIDKGVAVEIVNMQETIDTQKAEIERLKINLANEKKWGKIQAKQAEKDMARKILGELDLFFKGTTFRKGYEFKKIMEKLKEMAKSHGVEVDYEN